MKSKFAVSLFIVLALTGCGKKESATPASANPIPVERKEEKTDLNFTFKIGFPQKEAAWMKEQVQSHLAKSGYDKVKVESINLEEEEISQVKDWSTQADIYSFPGEELLSLKKAGALAKLPKEVVEELSSNMSESVTSSSLLGEDRYAYPFTANASFLYYNTDIVSDKEVDTLDHLIIANKAKGVKTKFSVKNSWYGLPLLTTFGASWTFDFNQETNEIFSVHSDFNSAKGLKGAKLLSSLIYSEDTLVDGEEHIIPSIANGFGSVVTGKWDYSIFTTQEGGIDKDKLHAAKLPLATIDDESKNIKNFACYKMYGVNPMVANEPKRLALAHEVANYLVSKEFQIAKYRQFQTQPIHKACASEEDIKKDASALALLNQLPYSLSQTFVPSNFYTAYDTLYESIARKGSLPNDSELSRYLEAFNTSLQTQNK